MNETWHDVHASDCGWGYINQLDQREVWLSDVWNFLGESYRVNEANIDETHELLQPFLEDQRLRMRKYFEEHPINFEIKNFVLPKVNKPYPSLAELFA